MLEPAGPALLLAVLAGLHLAYFKAFGRRAAQQPVEVERFPPPVPGPAAAVPLPASTARPSRYRRDLVLVDAFYGHPLICGCGLTLNGLAMFQGPVKVSGDLVVAGAAVFSRPVVVKGRVVVLGEAIFRQGLLTKSALVVKGRVSIGAASQGGWLVAREAQVQGDLWLNGQAETTGSPSRRRA